MSQEPGQAPRFAYGGQALMEGIYMRGKDAIGVAVRGPDGQIFAGQEPLDSVLHRRRFARAPFFRGIVVLYETLVIGTRWLMRSGSLAAAGEGVSFGGKQRLPWVRFSPDGRTVAFLSDRDKGRSVWLLPMDGGEPRRLTDRDAVVVPAQHVAHVPRFVARGLVAQALRDDERRVAGVVLLAGHDLAVIDPHFDANDAEGGVGACRAIVDVGTQRMQRHTTLAIPF